MSDEHPKAYEVHLSANDALDVAANRFRDRLHEVAAFVAMTAPDRPAEVGGEPLLREVVYDWDIQRAEEYLRDRRAFLGDLPHRERRVFISYRRDDDHGFVKELRARFDGEEIAYFVAPDMIAPGELWPEVLRRELTQCSVLVALITPGYRDGEWCLVECGAAWVGRDTGVRILPVLRGVSSEAIPEVFRTLQAIEGSDSEQLDDVVAAVKARLGST